MQQLVHLLCSLLSLDVLDKSKHSLLGKIPREHLADQSIDVEASKSNELPAVAHFCEMPRELLQELVRVTGSIPIERGRQVIAEESVRFLSMDSLSELASNLQVRGSCLHPEHVAVVTEYQASSDAVINRPFNSVESFLSPRNFPVKEERESVFGGKVHSLG